MYDPATTPSNAPITQYLTPICQSLMCRNRVLNSASFVQVGGGGLGRSVLNDPDLPVRIVLRKWIQTCSEVSRQGHIRRVITESKESSASPGYHPPPPSPTKKLENGDAFSSCRGAVEIVMEPVTRCLLRGYTFCTEGHEIVVTHRVPYTQVFQHNNATKMVHAIMLYTRPLCLLDRVLALYFSMEKVRLETKGHDLINFEKNDDG